MYSHTNSMEYGSWVRKMYEQDPARPFPSTAVADALARTDSDLSPEMRSRLLDSPLLSAPLRKRLQYIAALQTRAEDVSYLSLKELKTFYADAAAHDLYTLRANIAPTKESWSTLHALLQGNVNDEDIARFFTNLKSTPADLDIEFIKPFCTSNSRIVAWMRSAPYLASELALNLTEIPFKVIGTLPVRLDVLAQKHLFNILLTERAALQTALPNLSLSPYDYYIPLLFDIDLVESFVSAHPYLTEVLASWKELSYIAPSAEEALVYIESLPPHVPVDLFKHNLGFDFSLEQIVRLSNVFSSYVSYEYSFTYGYRPTDLTERTFAYNVSLSTQVALSLSAVASENNDFTFVPAEVYKQESSETKSAYLEKFLQAVVLFNTRFPSKALTLRDVHYSIVYEDAVPFEFIKTLPASILLDVATSLESTLDETRTEQLYALLAPVLESSQVFDTFSALLPEFSGSLEELIDTARTLS